MKTYKQFLLYLFLIIVLYDKLYYKIKNGLIIIIYFDNEFIGIAKAMASQWGGIK